MNLKSLKPKLRTTLKISQIDPTSYELEDPASGAILRLDGAGCLVAEQFESGEWTVDEARTRLKEQHALLISEEQIGEFLSKANAAGFFEIPLDQLGVSKEDLDSGNSSFIPSAEIAGAEEVQKLEKELRQLSVKKWVNYETFKKVLPVIIFFLFPWKMSVTGPLTIEPFQQTIIRTSSDGIVKEILVREGDRVSVGQTLLKMEGFDTEISRKKSEIKRVEAELEKLKSGSTKEEINQARKKVEFAQQVAKQAQETAVRYANLRERGLIPDQQWQTASDEAEIKRKALEEAVANLEIVQGGTRPEIIRAKLAEKESLIVDMNALLANQGKIVISSPIEGVVSTPETQHLVGKRLAKGDTILTVVNTQKMTTRIRITEHDIGLVRPGMPLTFKIQAQADRTFHATSTRISPVAEIQMIGATPHPEFSVYADVENRDSLLLPGMTGIGKIAIRWRVIGFVFFRHIVSYFRVQYVF